MASESKSGEAPGPEAPAHELDKSPASVKPTTEKPRVANPDVQELEVAPQGGRTVAMLLVVALLVGIGAGVSYFLTRDWGFQSTNDAYIEGRVVRISPKVSGQVLVSHVDDNTLVKSGEVLIEIDPADYQAKVEQAAAAVTAAESAVEQAKASIVRGEAAVGEAKAAAHAAETDARRSASDYHRFKSMGTDGVSEQQLDNGKAAADAGIDHQVAANKKVDAAVAEVNVTKTSVATAEAQVTAAKAQLHFAQLQLQYTKVVAPESGRITNRNVEQGAFVAVGQPLMAIIPEDKWVIGNFKEVQLEQIRIGQLVAVSVDSFPGLKLNAKVQSLQSGTGSRFQLLPPENATGNWVKVVQRLPIKIVFESGQSELQKLALGMSAEVTIDTRGSEVK